MARVTWLNGEIRVENLRQPLSLPDKASLAPAPPVCDSRVPCPVAVSAIASPCHAGPPPGRSSGSLELLNPGPLPQQQTCTLAVLSGGHFHPTL